MITTGKRMEVVRVSHPVSIWGAQPEAAKVEVFATRTRRNSYMNVAYLEPDGKGGFAKTYLFYRYALGKDGLKRRRWMGYGIDGIVGGESGASLLPQVTRFSTLPS